ncbi:hypothetical protein [Mammaliicoccus sciuri]|uniref:hypothetical protein n=1 Tax=Mammaliicoccus sciuri TaxID=1296 RepID=UPI002B261665|nr:hypothetical protein [Mammaliicoccus sciuri]WQL61696.1 hypothetical protein P3T96_15060 [Mammaliicoccus sciuri]
MNLSKERMRKLSKTLKKELIDMNNEQTNNFYLTGITEELYTSEEMLDILTDIQDVVILVRHKQENKSKIIKLKKENLNMCFEN